MQAALFQYDPVWEDREANMGKLRQMASMIETRVDLMIFSELTLTGFTMRSKRFAESLDGPSVSFFRDLACTYHTHVFGGLIEKKDDGCHNCLVHLTPAGNLAAVYRKIHPFSFSGENRFYNAGREPVITQIGVITVGMSICYDLRFPELFRNYGKARVEMIVNIANWPEARIAHWQTLLKARAIENQCFIVGVNRVGKDKKNTYNGCSAVFHPLGEEMLLAENREGVFLVGLDLNEVAKVRKTYPFLEDMVLV